MARKIAKVRANPTPAVQPRRAWPDIPWNWIAAGFSFLVLAWLVTAGDWDFFKAPGALERFYDAQAESLLHGRIDVEPGGIEDEAFMRNGKAYGYFGPTPALMRIPAAVLLPGMRGRWSRLSMLLASALMLGMLLLLLRNLETRLPELAARPLWKLLSAMLILAAGIGSTNALVSGESKVYQESIAWGGALSFSQAVCLAWYLTDHKSKWLPLICLTTLLAFLARVSSGSGPLFSLFVLDLALLLPFPRLRAYWDAGELPARGRVAAAFTATMVLAAASWLGLNYWKFGMFFTSQPIAMNLQYTAERLQNVKGNLASLANLPLTLSTYLSPANIHFLPAFPWIWMVHIERPVLAARFPGAHFDYVEYFAGLPVAMPELFFAALAGTVLCFGPFRRELRIFRAPLCGALAGCGLLFIWGLITYRYLHDMFPWLTLASAVALACLVSVERIRLRRGLAGLFVMLTVYALWANFGFALIQQRLYGYGPAEKRMAFADLSNSTVGAGLPGLASHLSHWRGYLDATAFRSGNLTAAPWTLGGRPDQPVAQSSGAPPYAAEYSFDIPEEGEYELSIRYASPDARAVLLSVNRRQVAYACGLPTGGSTAEFQKWAFAGRYHLLRGDNLVGMTSNHAFPYLSMLRLVRVD